MTTTATVDVFDLCVPLTSTKESGRTDGVATTPGDLNLRARAYNGERRRSWSLNIPAENRVAHDRAVSLWIASAYGARSLRFTPPGESETEVFMEMPSGFRSVRQTATHYGLQVILTESK